MPVADFVVGLLTDAAVVAGLAGRRGGARLARGDPDGGDGLRVQVDHLGADPDPTDAA